MSASNQHELNAGMLRKALALPEAGVSGRLELHYVGTSARLLDHESTLYTLYDSRKGKPRSAEYRLYYASAMLQQRASEGDILIVLRQPDSTDLHALVVPAGSQLGSTLSVILDDIGSPLSTRFRHVRKAIGVGALEQLLASLTEPIAGPDAGRVIAAADKTFVSGVLASDQLPTTRSMAEEAQRILAELWPGPIDADQHLFWLLEVETFLFQHLEQQLGQQALDAATQEGRIPFEAAVALVLSRLQSRKSRRGQSLQHHFAAVLTRNGIPYTAQGVTEGKESPDFIIPGQAAYDDKTLPDDLLRMVACKSVVRERWRQILSEAARIEAKYLLTVDTDLSTDGLQAMRAANLSVFMPRQVLDTAYDGGGYDRNLRDVGALLDELRAVLR